MQCRITRGRELLPEVAPPTLTQPVRFRHDGDARRAVHVALGPGGHVDQGAGVRAVAGGDECQMVHSTDTTRRVPLPPESEPSRATLTHLDRALGLPACQLTVHP